ncbi:23 kDa integral membrane protein-like [Condylostylus longicornis]|uniref:23 kDa integral membrane protein-like n=1 Tax=Condylostylus longicornis TaxID=2530218 RepID=UPI00244DE023|nr:23 kDa integral membrane protein-like [Condylostylus longicornis]
MIDDTNMTYIVEESETSRNLSVELISLGSVILAVGIFGCIANFKDSFCMCVTWAVFLVIMIVVQAGATALIYYSQDEFLQVMDIVIEKVFKLRSAHADKLDELQSLYNCCGVRGPIDYKVSAHYGYFPRTCCDKQYEEDVCSEATLYKDGCKIKYHEWWELKWNELILGCMAIGAIEVGGVFSAIWMAVNLKIIEKRGFTKSKKNKK